MSWGGYIPGHLIREIIESEELALFAEVDKQKLVDKIVNIIDEEVCIYGGGCCDSPYMEYQSDAAKAIIALVERILEGKETL